MRSRTPRVVAAVVVLAAAAACSGGTDTAATTTTTPATTTAAPATTTTGVPLPDACGVGKGPAAVQLTEATADADGDGLPDKVLTYGVGTDPSNPVPWHLRVEPATGNPAEIELPNPIAPVPVQALGGTDLSGDGRAELFVVVGGGTSLLLVGIFQLDGCAIGRVVGPDGQPSVLPVEAEPNHRRGIRCDGARVFTRTADSDDGVNFRTGEGKLLFSNGALIPNGAPTLGTLSSPADDAAIASYSTIDCSGVATPAPPTG